jgi:hypothetical protein
LVPLSGLFGIGGGVIIVPALIYLAGFDQHLATGTSLAVLLPPVGFGAAIEYYRQGHVDLKAAIVIAVALFVCAWSVQRLLTVSEGPICGCCSESSSQSLGYHFVYDAIKRLP